MTKKLKFELHRRFFQIQHIAKKWTTQHGTKILAAGIFILIVTQKDLSVQFDLNAIPASSASLREVVPVSTALPKAVTTSYKEDVPLAQPKNVSTHATEPGWLSKVASVFSWGDSESTAPARNVSQNAASSKDDNLANTYSNMTFKVSDYAGKNGSAALTAKQKKQLAYVDKFVKVAQKEMEAYGIPASITLAQGLIESNCGDSRLATKNNNHFGMKCFSRTCRKGHCSNFTDDSHKDFFRKYKSSWESYRAHSKLLVGKRYRHLKKLGTKDYKNWAYGLKKAGYATDKLYAEKLISLVESLELYKYDQ